MLQLPGRGNSSVLLHTTKGNTLIAPWVNFPLLNPSLERSCSGDLLGLGGGSYPGVGALRPRSQSDGNLDLARGARTLVGGGRP